MARVKNSETTSVTRKDRPGFTTEARENQMISKAENLAEKKLDDGTASDGLIMHYLKLGTIKAELEREKLRHETELLKAKTDSLESAKNSEAMFAEAIKAIRTYQGVGGGNEDDEYY